MKNKQPGNIKSGAAVSLEREILHILCHHGPSTLPFIIEELSKQQKLNTSEILKALHGMENQGCILLIAAQIGYTEQRTELH